jgi:hypothetical protein
VIGGVGGALSEASDALKLQGELLAQTNAGIKSTGGVANVTAQHILDFGQSIEDATGIEQEAVQASQNMLLTFTNVRNEVGKDNDIFDQATQAVTDMATKMNNGLAPSAEQMSAQSIQLGKALNDPIKGISALSKVGVTFTDAQKKMITEMVNSGNTMGAQKVILAELQTEFGGAAQAFGETDAGKIAMGNNKMGAAFEKLMVPIEKITVVVMPLLADAMTFVIDVVEKVVNVIGQVLSPVIEALGPVVKNVIGAIGPVVNALLPIFKALGAVVGAVFAAIGKVIGVAVGIIKAEFTAIGLIVGVLANIFRGVATVVTAVFSTIGGIIKNVINGVIGVINAVIGAIDAIQVHIHVGPVNLDWNGLNIPRLRKFHLGGVVPGAAGTEQLAVLQAGETVLPASRGLSRAPGGIVINIASFIGSDRDIDRLAARIAQQVRLAQA